jgi:L-amino acid N-acyltransferase YncA
MQIRAVAEGDAAAIAAIYNHYVLHTIVTFEETPVADAEMAQRIRTVTDHGLPWLVAQEGDVLLGYAYATKWKERIGYRFSVESSVYLRHDVGRRGIGTRLYEVLFDALQSRGIHTVMAGIGLPNAGSVALHEKFGMTRVAHLVEIGCKFGRWVDVGYWQRVLPTGAPAAV